MRAQCWKTITLFFSVSPLFFAFAYLRHVRVCSRSAFFRGTFCRDNVRTGFRRLFRSLLECAYYAKLKRWAIQEIQNGDCHSFVGLPGVGKSGIKKAIIGWCKKNGVNAKLYDETGKNQTVTVVDNDTSGNGLIVFFNCAGVGNCAKIRGQETGLTPTRHYIPIPPYWTGGIRSYIERILRRGPEHSLTNHLLSMKEKKGLNEEEFRTFVAKFLLNKFSWNFPDFSEEFQDDKARLLGFLRPRLSLVQYTTLNKETFEWALTNGKLQVSESEPNTSIPLVLGYMTNGRDYTVYDDGTDVSKAKWIGYVDPKRPSANPHVTKDFNWRHLPNAEEQLKSLLPNLQFVPDKTYTVKCASENLLTFHYQSKTGEHMTLKYDVPANWSNIAIKVITSGGGAKVD